MCDRLFSGQNALGWRDTVKVSSLVLSANEEKKLRPGQVHNEEKEITKTVKGKEVKETKKWTFYEMSDYNVRPT